MGIRELFLRISGRISRYDASHNFTCDLCGREVFENERLCDVCRAGLPTIELFCPFCGRRVREEGVCLECKKQSLGVAKARSLYCHEGGAAALVLRFKRGEKYLAYTLAEELTPLLEREFSDCDALAFVPMTKKAERARGYNQSRLLAEELSRRTGKAVLDVAEKRKETKAQKTLGRAAREENLKGAFHLVQRREVRDRRILIVDDTMTTGATAGELAALFYRAGADRVVLGTVCVEHPEVLYEAVQKYGAKIVAGIDAKDGYLAVRGWTQLADKDAFEFGCEAKALGVADAVFTDVGRDGALTGVNLADTVRMGETGLNIIASGGIRDGNDLAALKQKGVYGAILGRSIYTGAIDLKRAIEEM